MSSTQLRILTYNIHKGFSAGNRRFVLHRLREALLESNADILLLQEMQGEHRHYEQKHQEWPDCSHSEFLAQDEWPHIAYAENARYSLGHHGNAILSKFPFISWENINVSPVSWASRSLLHGVIHIPGLTDNLHIICIHLGLMSAERRKQFDILCRRVEEHVPRDSPLIVAGDFNDWTQQAEKLFSQRFELKEAYQTLHKRHARTWPAWLPILKMDRIYYHGIEPSFCERLDQGIWQRLSDHAPLIATFELDTRNNSLLATG